MVDRYKIIDYILLVIFIVSFISSLALSLKTAPAFCVTPSSCNIVETSKYAFVYGIKASYFGVVIFAFLSALTAWHTFKPHHYKKWIIRLGVVMGSVVAVYFLFLQIFVLRAYCTYCLIVDIGTLLALVSVFVHWRYGERWKGS